MSIQKSVAAFSPNTSIVLLDSRFRQGDPNPFDFTANLPVAIRGQRFIYKGLAWTQPLFNHNLTNNEIKFVLQGQDAPVPYVCYASPWKITSSFDGNPDGSVYQPPVAGSYAYDIQYAFNNDVRLSTANAVKISNVTVNGGSVVQFFFRYNPSRGFVLYAELGNGTRVPIRLESCNWISGAHFVHGFGEYNQSTGTYEPESQLFQTAIYGSLPTLVYTRYVIPSCREISENRIYPSITNNTKDGELPFELGVFFVNHNLLGVYNVERSTGDESVVQLTFGHEPSLLRISLFDDNGNIIKCGDPLTKFSESQTISPYTSNQFISGDYRNDDAMNWIMFDFDPDLVLQTLGGFPPVFVYDSFLTVDFFENSYPSNVFNVSNELPFVNNEDFTDIQRTFPLILDINYLPPDNNVQCSTDAFTFLPYNIPYFIRNDSCPPYESVKVILLFKNCIYDNANGQTSTRAYLYFRPIDAANGQYFDFGNEGGFFNIQDYIGGAELTLTFDVTNKIPQMRPNVPYRMYLGFWFLNPPADVIRISGINDPIKSEVRILTEYSYDQGNNVINKVYPVTTKYGDPDTTALCDDIVHFISVELE